MSKRVKEEHPNGSSSSSSSSSNNVDDDAPFPSDPNDLPAVARWHEANIAKTFARGEGKTSQELVKYFESYFGYTSMSLYFNSFGKTYSKKQPKDNPFTNNSQAMISGYPIFIYSISYNKLFRTSLALLEDETILERFSAGSAEPVKAMWVVIDGVEVATCRVIVTTDTL
jgi:hypothetical protein